MHGVPFSYFLSISIASAIDTPALLANDGIPKQCVGRNNLSQQSNLDRTLASPHKPYNQSKKLKIYCYCCKTQHATRQLL
mmetsp:Transcript_15878/g.33582  ORF Transcript_15878/g.33582 Transcript_15878/m.33582 type:complete len:80 (-) Transcript_15878:2638-2877(-)